MEEARGESELPGIKSWGLCSTCRYVRLVPNDRGRVFVLCQASDRFSRLPKYPHLPVRVCPAYTPHEDPG